MPKAASVSFSFTPADYPRSPGVYLMKNQSGAILYVGKAKDLRARLSSYFRSGADLTPKTRALVARMARIDLLHTATEKEALLLEASLIKKHRPRYNVVLRDDKQYVLFRLDKTHAFPRLLVTRKVVRDGSAYFGPFTSAVAARRTYRLLGRVFPLRKCPDHAFANRVRPCLYHDMGQCLAPCTRDVDPEVYAGLVRRVECILRGRTGELLASLRKEMAERSEALEFEKAAQLRDQIRAVESTVERQAVVLSEPEDLDAWALAPTDGGLGAAVVFVRQGRLLDEKTFYFPGLTEEEGPDMVAGLLVQFYGPERFIPGRILAPYLDGPDGTEEGSLVAEALSERRQGPVRIAEAVTGDEKRLKGLARKAAALARSQAGDSGELVGRRLGLSGPARRIECVDVSHTGGQATRAGLVVFEDGQRMPEDSRVYDLEDAAKNGDDYAALHAWARRRAASGPPWPDLVLVDGGRGQLEAVRQGFDAAVAEGMMEETPELAAIAKGESRRAGELGDRIFRPGRKNHLPLSPGSPELLFLQRIRDEAHRFVLGRQRRARKKQVMKSEVTSLPGVGQTTARLLWERFESLDAMRKATVEDLMALPGIGRKRAQAIHDALKV